MIRHATERLKNNLLYMTAALLAAVFMLLVPIAEDVAFDRLDDAGRGQSRYYRNGTDRVLSLPVVFADPGRAVLPPLPDFQWHDIFLSRRFRAGLPELYDRDGFPLTRHQFFAGQIGVSVVEGIRSHTFYCSWQYSSRNFDDATAHRLFRRAVGLFTAGLAEQKITATPGSGLVLRRAGHPALVLSLALVKTRHILLPLCFLFLTALLLRRRVSPERDNTLRVSSWLIPAGTGVAVFHLYFLPSLHLPLYVVGSCLLGCLAWKKRFAVLRAPLAALLLSLPLLALLLLVQAERLVAPQSHDTSDSDELVRQRVTLTATSPGGAHWPAPPAALPESTLFHRRLLEQEQGKQDPAILRLYLANPVYKIYLRKELPAQSLYLVMEYNRKLVEKGVNAPVPDDYFLKLFAFYRENLNRFLQREGRTLQTGDEPGLLRGLPVVPFPLRQRAILAFAGFVLLALAAGAFASKRPARS